jgi:hypothetical protein
MIFPDDPDLMVENPLWSCLMIMIPCRQYVMILLMVLIHSVMILSYDPDPMLNSLLWYRLMLSILYWAACYDLVWWSWSYVEQSVMILPDDPESLDDTSDLEKAEVLGCSAHVSCRIFFLQYYRLLLNRSSCNPFWQLLYRACGVSLSEHSCSADCFLPALFNTYRIQLITFSAWTDSTVSSCPAFD